MLGVTIKYENNRVPLFKADLGKAVCFPKARYHFSSLGNPPEKKKKKKKPDNIAGSQPSYLSWDLEISVPYLYTQFQTRQNSAKLHVNLIQHMWLQMALAVSKSQSHPQKIIVLSRSPPVSSELYGLQDTLSYHGGHAIECLPKDKMF